MIADAATQAAPGADDVSTIDISMSPPRLELLSPAQQDILTQFLTADASDVPKKDDIEQRVRHASNDVEFLVDQLSHSVHAISSAKDVTGRMAGQSMSNAAKTLDQRDEHLDSQDTGPKVDALDALRGLARILNSRR